jgi:CubicO group peptidase (beta-lactamase class C family)
VSTTGRRSRPAPTRRRRAALALGIVLALGVSAASCSDDGDGAASDTAAAGEGTTATTPAEPAVDGEPVAGPVPGQEWATADPAEVGLDPAVLDELAAAADASASSCLVVVRDGRIAGEWYFDGAEPDTPREVFSVTKSITSVLVGIAQDRGALAVDDPASRWITEWQGTASEPVTVEDLLSNDSGRTWTDAGNWQDLITQADQTAYGIGLGQQDPPGTAWRYDNSAIQSLDAVLEGAVGGDVGAWADSALFQPIGMHHTSMGHDAAGNTLTYAWARSTCRDLARFGLLALHHGDWGGSRIVSDDWIAASTAEPSSDLTTSYGYLWWLNLDQSSASAPAPAPAPAPANAAPVGQVVAGAPTDLYWAQGLGNQLVQVHPATHTVLVRLSGDGVADPGSAFGPATAARLVTEAVVGPAS